MIEPRPFQKQLLAELRDEKAIGIFSKTGSGKTYMSLFRFLENPTSNLLIICPPHVVEQWEDNVLDVVPDINIIRTKRSVTNKVKDAMYLKLSAESVENSCIVTSLSSIRLLPNLKTLVNEDWTVIVDESHRIKDSGTLRSPVQVTRSALQIGSKTPYKIILTATPAQKNFGGYIDYYTQLKFLDAHSMSLSQFKSRYCIEEEKIIRGLPFPIKVITGYTSHVGEVEELLLRHTRSYSPEYTEEEPTHTQIKFPRVKSYGELVKERAYEELLFESPTAFRIAKKTLTGGTVMGRGLFDQRLTYDDNTVKQDWIKEFLTDQDEKVFILYQYNVEREQIIEACKRADKKYIVLDGNNPNKSSDIANKDYDVIIGQIKACGESLDGLQYKTHICIYYSMPESSTEYIQTLGRIYRDGQVTAPTYYYLTMDKTIDTIIYKLTQEKVEFTQETLDRLSIEEEF